MEQVEIIERATSGKVELPFASVTNGSVELLVFADALRIDGVRVGVSHATTLACADALGCLPTTALIEDLIYSQAIHNAHPVTHREPISTWQAVLDHNLGVERQLPLNRSAYDLVATVGKSWVLTRNGRPTNYGWHAPFAWFGQVKVPIQFAVTPGFFVVQSLGGKHNAAHWDYSQTLRLVCGTCLVDGKARALRNVLADPALCKFVTHEGPFKPEEVPGYTPDSPLPVLL